MSKLCRKNRYLVIGSSLCTGINRDGKQDKEQENKKNRKERENVVLLINSTVDHDFLMFCIGHECEDNYQESKSTQFLRLFSWRSTIICHFTHSLNHQ
jgi:hypothetical protein